MLSTLVLSNENQTCRRGEAPASTGGGGCHGYCRVSTTKQSLKRQQDNIHNAYPDAKCFSEEYTGTTSNRPQWQKLLKAVHEGDTIIFDSVSRMSRNAEEGFQDYKALFEMGVNLIFLKEPYVNTETCDILPRL